jgi:hypothetical protein
VFHFESKINEIDNEDEEVVNSNGPIFHFNLQRRSLLISAHLTFFLFTFKFEKSNFGAEPTTHSTQGVELVIVIIRVRCRPCVSPYKK